MCPGGHRATLRLRVYVLATCLHAVVSMCRLPMRSICTLYTIFKIHVPAARDCGSKAEAEGCSVLKGELFISLVKL